MVRSDTHETARGMLRISAVQSSPSLFDAVTGANWIVCRLKTISSVHPPTPTPGGRDARSGSCRARLRRKGAIPLLPPPTAAVRNRRAVIAGDYGRGRTTLSPRRRVAATACNSFGPPPPKADKIRRETGVLKPRARAGPEHLRSARERGNKKKKL